MGRVCGCRRFFWLPRFGFGRRRFSFIFSTPVSLWQPRFCFWATPVRIWAPPVGFLLTRVSLWQTRFSLSRHPAVFVSKPVRLWATPARFLSTHGAVNGAGSVVGDPGSAAGDPRFGLGRPRFGYGRPLFSSCRCELGSPSTSTSLSPWPPAKTNPPR